MRLTNDDIDFDALYKISPELTLVVAMAVGTEWNELSRLGYESADVLQWSIMDTNKSYVEALRNIAATALYLLLNIEN